MTCQARRGENNDVKQVSAGRSAEWCSCIAVASLAVALTATVVLAETTRDHCISCTTVRPSSRIRILVIMVALPPLERHQHEQHVFTNIATGIININITTVIISHSYSPTKAMASTVDVSLEQRTHPQPCRTLTRNSEDTRPRWWRLPTTDSQLRSKKATDTPANRRTARRTVQRTKPAEPRFVQHISEDLSSCDISLMRHWSHGNLRVPAVVVSTETGPMMFHWFSVKHAGVDADWDYGALFVI